MSLRFRIVFVAGCLAVVALHAPRCIEALAGLRRSEAPPSAVAALDPVESARS